MVQPSRSNTATTIPLNTHAIRTRRVPQARERTPRLPSIQAFGKGTTETLVLTVGSMRTPCPHPLLPNTLPNSHSTAYPLHLKSGHTSGYLKTRMDTRRSLSSVTHTYIIIKDKRIYIYIYKPEQQDAFIHYPCSHCF